MAWKRSFHSGWAVAVLLAGLVFASWAGLSTAQEGDTRARVVHAALGLGPVDVYVDGDLAIEALDYGAATEYLALPAGEYDVQITEAGAEAADAIIDAVLVLEGGTPHTVVAIGPADRADVAVIIDDHTPPSDEMAKLSLVNVTSDSIAVGLALQDGTALIEDVPFADASEYLELEVGVHDFVIVEVDSGDEVASIPGFSVEPGTVYSIFALGAEGEYQGVVFVDDVGSDPEPAATPTESASTPAIVESTPATTGAMPTPTPTATAEATSTPLPTATATVMPALPDTGDGGASEGGGSGIVVASIVALLTLAVVAIWRLGRARTPGRS